MLLHRDRADSVPPDGILKFPWIGMRFPKGQAHIDLVRGHCSRITACESDVLVFETCFLSDLNLDSPLWVFGGNKTPSRQSPPVLSSMLDKQHFPIRIEYHRGCSHV